MRDLIRDVIGHCASSCNMGKISVNDKISIKAPKIIETIGVKKFLHEIQSKGLV